MARKAPPENTPRVIALAVAFFVFLFARVPAEQVPLLSLLALAFAVLAYAFDPQVRAALSLRRRESRRRAPAPRTSNPRMRGDDAPSSAVDA